jgi:hypothetical protein
MVRSAHPGSGAHHPWLAATFCYFGERLVVLFLVLIFSFLIFLFIYSHVHTLLGHFSPYLPPLPERLVLIFLWEDCCFSCPLRCLLLKYLPHQNGVTLVIAPLPISPILLLSFFVLCLSALLCCPICLSVRRSLVPLWPTVVVTFQDGAHLSLIPGKGPLEKNQGPQWVGLTW